MKNIYTISADKAIDVMTPAVRCRLADKPDVDLETAQKVVSRIRQVPIEMISVKRTDNYANLKVMLRKKYLDKMKLIKT